MSHDLVPTRTSKAGYAALFGFASLFLIAPHAFAGVTNGSFETNDGFHYTSWTLDGGGMVVTNQFGDTPTDGSYQGFITSDGTGMNNVYGIPGDNINPSIAASTLSADLGVTQTDLNLLYSDTDAIQGSAISQSITATAGDKLTFDWNFLTAEDPTAPSFGAPYNDDFSFFVVNGQAVALDDTFSANTTGTATPFPGNPSPSNSDYLIETGYQTFTFTIPTTGTYTLGFGVVDGLTDPNTTGASDVASALLIDNVSINGATVSPTPTPTPVATPTPITTTSTPEPNSGFAVLIGLLMAAVGMALNLKRGVSKISQ